jgi:hypothetical protein
MMKSLISAMLAGSLLVLPSCRYHSERPEPQAGDQPHHWLDGYPVVDRKVYEGPRIAADGWGTEHRIVLIAPTGGWSLALDHAREVDGHVQVFVSAVRPDPGLMVTQALERHEIKTDIDSRRPIEVFARIVEPTGDPADFPYRRAARSEYRIAPERERRQGRP